MRNFSSRQVSSACEALQRRNQPFPPSAGELHQQCVLIAEQERRAEEWARDRRVPQVRLPPPRHDYTPEELADFSLDINVRGARYVCREVDGVPLIIPPGYPGAGKPTYYGYVTPSEARTYPGGGISLGSAQPPRRGSMAAEEAEYRRAVTAGEADDFTLGPIDLPPMSDALARLVGARRDDRDSEAA